MARRDESVRFFAENAAWRKDASASSKDTSTNDRSNPALLQSPHSPQPLLEERRRSRSGSGNTKRPRARTKTSVTLQQPRPKSHSPDESSNSSPSDQPKLQISDERLAEVAREAASAIDWDNLRAGRTSVWDKKTTLGDFGIYTRRSSSSGSRGCVHHIMASGSVACSIAEMQHILCTTTSARYEAAMAELHGASFLTGAVVHKVNTRIVATGAHGSASTSKSPVDPRSKGCFDLTVKTATFAKAHVFARQEHWCYLDFFQPQADKKKFLLTMHSLYPEDVLLPARASTISHRGARTSIQPSELPVSSNQLQEMSAGYSVVADERRGLVWIIFYAQFVDTSALGAKSFFPFISSGQSKHLASKSTIKKRLMKMAKATCCLPMIVRRRRLGAQVFVDHKAFTPPNTHCICCTAALSLLTKKSQRCHLCGYCVCDKCSSKQQIERAHTLQTHSPQSLPTVRVCLTCSRRVDDANYDSISTGVVSPSAIKRDEPDALPATKLLADLLRDSFENAVDDGKKRAVIQVIKNLLDQQKLETRSSSASTMSSSDHFQQHQHQQQQRIPKQPRKLSTDEDFLNALDTDLHVKSFALGECELGSNAIRSYPISYKDELETSVPNFPVPANEEYRLETVHQRRLSDIKNVPELEIICSIARKELECMAGIVTLVDEGEVHVIASSESAFQNLIVPRGESICSHTIMTDKPLLISHASADVRFSRMAAMREGGLNYYCGFPLIMSDKSVVGSVCCVDTQDHDVTQAQYAVMKKLAATASRVMEMHTKADAA